MIPQKLVKGDEVRIVAPSRSMAILGEDCIQIATERLESLGLKVTFAEHVKDFDPDYMCTNAKDRADDLNEAFRDPNVKAILTVIGGFNSNQILKYLDFELIKNNPKILCGFSDITILLDAIYAKTGLVTYYGPHYSSFGMKKGFEYTFEYFKRMLMENGGEADVESAKQWSDDAWFIDQENREFIDNPGMFIINEGVAEGNIVGGNLCTLNLLQGTEYMPDIANSILFLEDDEMAGKLFLVEFDRDLVSLIGQPGFDTVKGIVIGRCQKSSEMTNEKWIKLIKSKPELEKIPVIAGCDFGHTTPIITFPIGGKASLKAIDGKIELNIKG
ncbi:MAG: LD-carboxypeptidase [Clostridia bacterium]|nr:LD-carboxypeptidase [Clostridia bacterium]